MDTRDLTKMSDQITYYQWNYHYIIVQGHNSTRYRDIQQDITNDLNS